MTYFFGGAERPVYPYLSGTGRFYRTGDYNSFGYSAAAEAIVMLMDAVGLNGSLYYHQIDVGNDAPNTDAFGLALGVAAFIF